MLKYHVKANGGVFKKDVGKKILTKAIEQTKDWGLNKVREITPVKTGRLKSGWKLTPQLKSLLLSNDVFYSVYVNARLNIIGRSVPQIKNKLEENIRTGIKNL